MLFRSPARGARDAVVQDHPLYDALGRSADERRKAYRALFREALDPGVLDALRAATNGGWAFGGERFKREIAKAAGRRAAPAAKGRPPKAAKGGRQKNPL